MASKSSISSAVGYCRVSTKMQKAEGVSLETQEKAIQLYCVLKGITLRAVYSEAFSGKSSTRIEFKRALDDVRSGEFFIVHDLARFSRSTLDAMMIVKSFDERGVQFVSIRENIDLSDPMGRCLFRMLMNFYELERDKISANVKANLQRLSAEGKLRTKAPFGWRYVSKDKDMEKDPEQQVVIAKIVDMHRAGHNLNKIAQILNSSGDGRTLNNNKKTPSPNPVFYSHTIKRILMDQGVVPPDDPKRKPLDQRITSHHKSVDLSSSEDVLFVLPN